jgi:alkylhydroperoxidase family enzyme
MKAHGKVSDAGYSDAQIIEMVALSAQFLLTNFVNNAAQTDIDFPAIPDRRAA